MVVNLISFSVIKASAIPGILDFSSEACEKSAIH